MILTGENTGIRTETCPNSGLSTRNPTETVMGLNPSLSGQRPAAVHLSRGATGVSICGTK